MNWPNGRDLALGERPQKAVITVPAYFSDAQRNATREAGALAGLEVVRILNEPTAASLAYGYGDGSRHTALIYDLGGGTFDVSVVTVEGDITEVLASHGNNQLGGDDFDDLLVEAPGGGVSEATRRRCPPGTPGGESAACGGRPKRPRRRLSFEPYVNIREEALVMRAFKPLHLEVEISRERVRGHDSSAGGFHSRQRVKGAAGLRQKAWRHGRGIAGGRIDTHAPGFQLTERVDGDWNLGRTCTRTFVSRWARVYMAARLAGREVDRVLLDISPYSFGVSYLGERGGVPYPHCYKPIIRRNTALPLTRTEAFMTSYPFQSEVDVQVYQGEDDDALKNILVGDFRVEGLTADARCQPDSVPHAARFGRHFGSNGGGEADRQIEADHHRQCAAGQDRRGDSGGAEADAGIVRIPRWPVAGRV